MTSEANWSPSSNILALPAVALKVFANHNHFAIVFCVLSHPKLMACLSFQIVLLLDCVITEARVYLRARCKSVRAYTPALAHGTVTLEKPITPATAKRRPVQLAVTRVNARVQNQPMCSVCRFRQGDSTARQRRYTDQSYRPMGRIAQYDWSMRTKFPLSQINRCAVSINFRHVSTILSHNSSHQHEASVDAFDGCDHQYTCQKRPTRSFG